MGILQNFFGAWSRRPAPFNGLGSGLTWFLGGSRTNYDDLLREGLWRNATVATGLGWLSRNWSMARLIVVRVGADGVEENIGPHPVLELIKHPHPGMSGHVMISAMIRDIHCNGSFWMEKVYNGLGEVIELRPWINRQVLPIYPVDGSEYLSGWSYTVTGQTVPVPAKRVIHMRLWPDHADDRRGWSPLKALVREISVLDESSTYMSSLLRNFAVPGLIATPKGDWVSSEDDARAVKEKVKDALTGELRGEPVVLTGAYEIEKAGWSPEEIGLSKIPLMAQAQVLASMGLNVRAVGLGSQETGQDGAGDAESIRQAWVHGLMPLQEMFAAELTAQLLPDFEDAAAVRRGELKVTWDWSGVAELEDREQIIANRAIRTYQAGVTTLNEARDLCGYGKSTSADADLVGVDRAVVQMAAGIGQPGPLGPDLTGASGTSEGDSLGGVRLDRKPSQGGMTRRTGTGGKGSQGGGVASNTQERNGGVRERVAGAMGRSSAHGDRLAPGRAKAFEPDDAEPIDDVLPGLTFRKRWSHDKLNRSAGLRRPVLPKAGSTAAWPPFYFSQNM